MERMGVFRFDIDEEVRVRSNNKTGEIQIQQREKVYKNGKQIIQNKYYVRSLLHHSNWYTEDQLDFIHTFSKKFEHGLIDLMIDANLGENTPQRLDRIHMWNDKKENL